MKYALVLGGGGITGIAWETGLLKGLRDAGVDLTGADLIVGTSAGSVVGAQVATGVPLDELYARQLQPVNTAVERAPDIGPLTEFFSAARSPSAQGWARPTREVLAWLGEQARAAATGLSEGSRLEAVMARLHIHHWPERRLLVTAVDTEDGSFVVWDRTSGVALPLAVASSCAVPWVYPPVTINGRRYMDGGVRSTTNADVAAGYDLVLIVAPMGAVVSAALQEEVAELQDAGSAVDVVLPDEAALDAIGPNPLDPVRRPAAAAAGLAQAKSTAETISAVRRRLL
ncbi:MAG TPA: patatin-like phospholipase family protein [Candidatus Dormibacteraeota bacterium]|nr:patatin-like phospholipase family protein [Candidatus Dormibacteraeota bacterium]